MTCGNKLACEGDRSVDCGVLRDQPVDFTGAIMRSLAETGMDFISLISEQAERYREAGFVAYWNAILDVQVTARRHDERWKGVTTSTDINSTTAVADLPNA